MTARIRIFLGCTSDADGALYQARFEGKSCIGVTTRLDKGVRPGVPAAPRSDVTI